MLSKEALTEFQEIYKKEYGREITLEEANEMGTKLLELFRLIYKPLPEENCENFLI